MTDNRKNNEFVVVVVVLEEKKTGGEGSGKYIPSPTFMGPGPNPDLTPINAGTGGAKVYPVFLAPGLPACSCEVKPPPTLQQKVRQ